MTLPSREICLRALAARDARFDGRFFVAVRTTRIYCRPICPAGPAKRENCTFYRTAAEAQEAGYRPCLRCRPELAPEGQAWLGATPLVARALALVRDGALDDASVDALAAKVGVGARQLRRLFAREVGASPLAVAQTRRVHFAKQLIQDTALPMHAVAFAAGFGSVRRFNATFASLYGRAPGALRGRARDRAGGANGDGEPVIALCLPYRAPYDWAQVRAHFAARAVPGIESVDGDTYRRVVRMGGTLALVEIAPYPGRDALVARVRTAGLGSLAALAARIRRVFDLDADVAAIARDLGADAVLAPLIRRRPGLRVPGAWDGFELAIRAVLGQQITVAAARTLASRLVARHGEPLPAALAGHAALTRAFPSPAQLANADFATLGLPRARAATLDAIVRAALDDPALFAPDTDPVRMLDRFASLPGIGAWTAQYVALRALQEPDAFPAGDIALQRALARGGTRPTAAVLERRAEAWRPWRAYAAQHLWSGDAAS